MASEQWPHHTFATKGGRIAIWCILDATIARTLAGSSQLVDADLRRVVSPRLAAACDHQDILALVRQVAVPGKTRFRFSLRVQEGTRTSTGPMY